uniref:Uncharacterized protein n=1 Tax=Nothoprocta perdicaria TaxID=30464 RepID=A0A8C6ZFT9_NOTPE
FLCVISKPHLCPFSLSSPDSKLKLHMSRAEKCSLLSQCCQGIVCLRHPEQVEVREESAGAAPGVPVPTTL